MSNLITQNNENIVQQNGGSILLNIDIDRVKINGDEVSQFINFQSLKVRNRIDSNVDECTFTVKQYGDLSYKPNLNDEVEVYHEDVKIFGGVIVRIDTNVESVDNFTLNVQCVDYAHLLKRQLVTERYQNETVFNIIDDIITRFTTGFTINNVNVVKSVASISFNGLTVVACLEKLADALNCFWYVDYDKDIHFFLKSTELAPFNLTDSSGFIADSLTIREDITQLRNRVTVRGGTNPSDTNRTETYVSADNNQDVYPLGYKFALLPIVTVNGTPVSVGAEYLTDDASVDCQWSFGEKYIRFTAGNFPSIGDVVVIEGKILIPVIARTSSNESISEYGVFEYLVRDETIKTTNEAIDRAISELQSYADKLNEGDFKTYQSGLKAGQVINILSTKRGVNLDLMIQEVSTRFRTPLGSPEYTVTFATLKTIGIIEFLQKRLLGEKLDEDEIEELLNYDEVSDLMSMQDEVIDVLMTTAPYYWFPADSGSQGIWNFSTWS